MNDNQKLLITLLSAAMRRQTPQIIETRGTDWENVFKEAKIHDIYSILYPVVRGLSSDQSPNKECITRWKNSVNIAGITQVQHDQRMKDVLNAFNQSGIPVIALKGLVLRELYPQAELRTMCDADILVHKKDIDRAKAVLLHMGYLEDKYFSHHKDVSFSHPLYLTIEVHWRLTTHEFANNDVCIENKLWERAVTANICNEPVLTLSLEDLMLHLCLHMAMHFIGSGFCLRQLCDLVLLIESKGKLIDWKLFYENVKTCGIEQFVFAIFSVCHKLFDMSVPEILYSRELVNDPFMEAFINDIFSLGNSMEEDGAR